MNAIPHKRRKTVIAAVLLFLVFPGILFCLRKQPLPDPGKADKNDISSFIAGRDFIRMPEVERHKFMKELKRHGRLPYMLEPEDPKKRENFRRHMEMFKQERLKKFYDMSPAEQEKALREAVKDRVKELEYRKKNPLQEGSLSHRKELEGQSPEERARTIDFSRKLEKHIKNGMNGEMDREK